MSLATRNSRRAAPTSCQSGPRRTPPAPAEERTRAQVSPGVRSRRRFCGAWLVAGLVLLLAPVLALGQAAADARLAVETVTIETAKFQIRGYLARPATPERRPAVLVVQDRRASRDHLETLARRLAADGFVVLVPDLDEVARKVLGEAATASRAPVRRLPPEDVEAALLAAADFLARNPAVSGPIGAIGFGWGGRAAFALAGQSDRLAAAVIYYGNIPVERLRRTKAAMLIHDPGEAKTNVMALEKALTGNGIVYSLYGYPQVRIGFANELLTRRYDREAAELAWERTVAFLRKHLAPRT